MCHLTMTSTATPLIVFVIAQVTVQVRVMSSLHSKVMGLDRLSKYVRPLAPFPAQAQHRCASVSALPEKAALSWVPLPRGRMKRPWGDSVSDVPRPQPPPRPLWPGISKRGRVTGPPANRELRVLFVSFGTKQRHAQYIQDIIKAEDVVDLQPCVHKQPGCWVPPRTTGLQYSTQKVVLESDGFVDSVMASLQMLGATDSNIIGIACNRGHHRSVFIAELMADWLPRLFFCRRVVMVVVCDVPNRAVACAWRAHATSSAAGTL